MRGGSIASDSVTTLVKPPTYDSMNQHFDNLTEAGMCGGASKKKKPVTPKKKSCSNCKKPVSGCNCGNKVYFKWGGMSSILNKVWSDLSNNFTEQFVNSNATIKSLPAPATYMGGKPKKPAPAPQKPTKKKTGGSIEFKNINELKDDSKVNIYNKKYGGNGLDYHTGITTRSYQGTPVNRNLSPEVLEVISNSSVTNAALSDMNKAVEYGSYVNVGSSSAFNYGGLKGGNKKGEKKGSKSKPKGKK